MLNSIILHFCVELWFSSAKLAHQKSKLVMLLSQAKLAANVHCLQLTQLATDMSYLNIIQCNSLCEKFSIKAPLICLYTDLADFLSTSMENRCLYLE